jgi:acyl-CoA thioesterase I
MRFRRFRYSYGFRYSSNNRLSRFVAGLLAFGMLVLAGAAQADTIRIVALGASNTAGRGVDASQAWPAQLAGLLKAKGYDVSMTVEGVMGDTSAGIASRADSIPAGTRIVLFDTGPSNDRKKGVSEAERAANIGQIGSRIRAHGAVAIEVSYLQIPASLRQSDGIHLTPTGHASLAAQLLPRVIAAVGSRH